MVEVMALQVEMNIFIVPLKLCRAALEPIAFTSQRKGAVKNEK